MAPAAAPSTDRNLLARTTVVRHSEGVVVEVSLDTVVQLSTVLGVGIALFTAVLRTNHRTRTELGGRIDRVEDSLRTQIAAVDARLSGAITALDTRLSGAAAGVDARVAAVDARVARVDDRVFQLATGLKPLLERRETDASA